MARDVTFDIVARDKASKTFDHIGRASGGLKSQVQGHLGGLAGALKGDFSGLTKSLAGGLGAIGPWGAAAGAVVAGIGAVAGTAGKIAEESIDAFKSVAGETLKLQRVMGGTAEDASRMRFAFHETGIDADTGAKAIGILSKNLVNMKPTTKSVTRQVAEATGEWRKHTAIIKDAEGHFKKVESMVPVTKMRTFKESVQVANPVLAALGLNAKDASGKIRPMADLLPEIADKFKSMPNGAEKSALALKLFGKGGLALLPFLNRGAAGIEELTKKSDKFGLTLSGKDLDALKKSREAHKDWDAAMEGAKVRIGAQLLPMVTKLVVYFQEKLIPIIVKAGAWVQKHGDQIQHVAGVIGQAVVTMVKVWWAWETVVFTVVKAIGKVFAWLWGSVLRPTITFMLHGLANVANAFAVMLDALSHIPGFGWAKAAADKLRTLAGQANAAADAINRIPRTVFVNTYFKTHGSPNPTSTNGGGNGVKGYASGGRNIPRGWAVVGENGPEFMFMRGGETVVPHDESMAMVRGGRGGSGVTIVNNITVNGMVGDEQSLVDKMHTLLLAKQRRTGVGLGFKPA